MDKPHKRLDVWKSAMELLTEIYCIARLLPQEENYALASQMKKAAISIPSNIAEGAARNTAKEFINFLHIAQGSLSELDTQLEITRRLGYATREATAKADLLMERTDKMLTGLIKAKKFREIPSTASCRSPLTPDASRLTEKKAW